MKSEGTFEKALPIIAAAYGEKLGVKVVLSGTRVNVTTSLGAETPEFRVSARKVIRSP